MNGNRPTYRKWLALFVLGLSIFNLVDPLSSPWDEILFWVALVCLFALIGPTWWEERRERKTEQSA